jgi:hypothetical protein
MSDATHVRPDPRPDGPGLVQPEGVNAGSAASTAETTDAAAAETRDALESVGAVEGSGSTPDPRTESPPAAGLPDSAVASSGGPRNDQQAMDGELPGAPDTTPQAPGQYAAESGQDSGSMG